MRILILLVLALQVLTACGDESTRWPINRFDPAKWATTKEESRFIYARDLVESKRLIGLSHKQVIELLGTPSYDDPQGDYVVYVLKNGPKSVYGLDIRFARNSSSRPADTVFIRWE
jgi:outer membrane protein assembly factor BamE (lipoprotein component of BamABCDE complex)